MRCTLYVNCNIDSCSNYKTYRAIHLLTLEHSWFIEDVLRGVGSKMLRNGIRTHYTFDTSAVLFRLTLNPLKLAVFGNIHTFIWPIEMSTSCSDIKQHPHEKCAAYRSWNFGTFRSCVHHQWTIVTETSKKDDKCLFGSKFNGHELTYVTMWIPTLRETSDTKRLLLVGSRWFLRIFTTNWKSIYFSITWEISPTFA